MGARHSVRITGTDEAPVLTFICHGDQDAPCRNYPACTCESWDDDHVHPKVPQERCWMADWFDNDGIDPQVECLADHEYRPGMGGPIEAWFREDYIEWEFAE